MSARSKDGWTLLRQHEKITLGRKQYRNMEEWGRECRVCGTMFTIHTAANAGNVNASFGLRTCKEHRGRRPEFMATTVAPGETEQLRIENRNLRDEIEGHLSYIAELKAELALHKPPTAQEALRENKLPWS